MSVRSCEKECFNSCDGQTTGTIPDWLEGTLIRTGPGLIKVGQDKYKHAFDGLALLHRFQIRQGGTVQYQNRFLDSRSYRKCLNAERIVMTEFGTASHSDPCATIFQRFKSFWSSDMTDNANINVMKIGDGVYVATETNFITRIDPLTLETKERVDLCNMLAVNTCTAHPHYDSSGALLNIGSAISTSIMSPSYCIVRFPSKGDASLSAGQVLCRIPFSRALYPSYYHSFGLSENYVIFTEQSLNMSIPKIVWNGIVGGSLEDALQWNPQQLVRFHLVRRSTGELLKLHLLADPFIVFHHANCFDSEDGQEVVVDLVAYHGSDVIIKSLYYEHMEIMGNDPKKFLTLNDNKVLRFVLPLKEPTEEQVTSGANMVSLPGSKAKATAREDGTIFCQPENLTPGLRTLEMPQYNYRAVNGKPYKYLYGVAKSREEKAVAGLAKVNVQKGGHVTWSAPGFVPSEPIFVARPGATQEDDGVLLISLLSEENEKEVSLLVLDARDMSELGRATFQSPGSIPSDLHGNFFKF